MEKRHPTGQFYGVTRCQRGAGELLLTESDIMPGAVLPRHSHENAYFCWVVLGTFTETYGRKSRECLPSTFKYHPPGEVHEERFHTAGARLFRVEVSREWLDHVREHSPGLADPAEYHDDTLRQLMSTLHAEFLFADGGGSQLAISWLALEIASAASRHEGRRGSPGRNAPGWVDAVREIVHERFADPPTIAAIAGQVGLHPVYLASAFRRHTRYSIGEYMRLVRVEYARRALATSDEPLVEIALAAGFADQSHFCRTFKRYTKLTPSEFRSAARKGV